MDRPGFHPKVASTSVARAVRRAVEPTTGALARAAKRTTTLVRNAFNPHRTSHETTLARLQAQQPPTPDPAPASTPDAVPPHAPANHRAAWAPAEDHADGYEDLRAQAAAFPASVRHLAATVEHPSAREAAASAAAASDPAQSTPTPASAPIQRKGMDDLVRRRNLPPTDDPQVQRMLMNQQLKLASTLEKEGISVAELLKEINEHVEQHQSRASPKTISGRNLILARWMLLYIQVYGDRPLDYAWDPEIVQELAPRFLEFTLKFVLGVRNRKRPLKSRTVQWWMALLCQSIIRYVTDPKKDFAPCGVQLLIEQQLFDTLSDQVVSLSNRFNLDRSPTRKLFFGLWEVLIMITGALEDMRTAPNPLYHIQSIIKILLPFYLTVRPTTIGPATQELLAQGFYIKLADIGIFKEEKGYEVHFTLRAFKGHFQSHSDRPQRMVVRSVQRPELAPFDLPSWLIVYLISIGAFQDFTTLDEFEASDVCQRHIKQEFLDYPLCCAANEGGHELLIDIPAMAHHFSDNCRVLCRRNGLPQGGTHMVRRGSAHEYALASDAVTSGLILHHKPSGDTAVQREFYSPGAEGVDVTALRLSTDPHISPASLQRIQDHHQQFSVAIDTLARIANDHVSYVEYGPAAAIKEYKQAANKAANERGDAHPEVVQAEAARDNLLPAYVALYDMPDPPKVFAITKVRTMFKHATTPTVKKPIASFKLGVTEEQASQQLALINAKHAEYQQVKKKHRSLEKDDDARVITDRALANNKEGTVAERQQARSFLHDAPSLLTANIIKDYRHRTAVMLTSEDQMADALDLDGADEDAVFAETCKSRPIVQVHRGATRARNAAAAAATAAQKAGAGQAEVAAAAQAATAQVARAQVEGANDELDAEGEDDVPVVPVEETTVPAVQDDGVEDDLNDPWTVAEAGRTLGTMSSLDTLCIFKRILFSFVIAQRLAPHVKVTSGPKKRVQYYICTLCAPLRAHLNKHHIKGTSAPELQETFKTKSQLTNHQKTQHLNEWRETLFTIARDGRRLQCPGCKLHKGSLDRLVIHMRFRCTEKAKYAQMFDDYREIRCATKGHTKPKGLIRRKGILDETTDVSDTDDDWSDWDGSDEDTPEVMPEAAQDAQDMPRVSPRPTAAAAAAAEDDDDDESQPSAQREASDGDESDADDRLDDGDESFVDDASSSSEGNSSIIGADDDEYMPWAAAPAVDDDDEDEERSFANISLLSDQQAMLMQDYETFSMILEGQFDGLGANVLQAVYEHSKTMLANAGGHIDIAPAEWQAALARVDAVEVPGAVEMDDLMEDCQNWISQMEARSPDLSSHQTHLAQVFATIRRRSAMPTIGMHEWEDAGHLL
uniref:Expressed protein n=1 Tax=Schizophyllum commune (strain H4-8 / FGSC 9210) TaxID=578458 RepID=D8PNE8_SCHCM